MEIFTRFRNQYLSWSRDVPLSTDIPVTTTTFQSWHEFDLHTDRWTAVRDAATTTHTPAVEFKGDEGIENVSSGRLDLITWNVDAMSELLRERISAIISHVSDLGSTVYVVFFQEISPVGLASLLENSHIRKYWLTSNLDGDIWQDSCQCQSSRTRLEDEIPKPLWPRRTLLRCLRPFVFTILSIVSRSILLYASSPSVHPPV
ncbi:hypothetical protein GGR56DRAFT_591561 [Xylariaceae sp. FL0804]|nr:hypothetical protein GGR56DRAFT_591561 [Xylariaceae sp. FL0804]